MKQAYVNGEPIPREAVNVFTATYGASPWSWPKHL